MTTRLGYLGPEGTFTSMALDAWPAADGAERVAFGSVDAALAALRAGDVDGAMVPIENSVEGGVSATLDALGLRGGLAAETAEIQQRMGVTGKTVNPDEPDLRELVRAVLAARLAGTN